MVATLDLVPKRPASENPGLRVRIPAELKDDWGAFCEKKRISQQDAVLAMVRWIMREDDVTQSMLLGQINPSPDLAALIAQRAADRHDQPDHPDLEDTADVKPPRRLH